MVTSLYVRISKHWNSRSGRLVPGRNHPGQTSGIRKFGWNAAAGEKSVSTSPA
jgi:hypothetical protein